MWSLCGSLTSAICVVSTIVNHLERSRVLGGRETFPSRRKAMTELVMQTKKRLAVYPSLNLAVIFSLLHVTYWCGKGELQAVEYQGSEMCTAQLCCCKPFHCGTNELLPCLLGQSNACPQPAGLLKERSLIRLIRKYASGVSLETRN